MSETAKIAEALAAFQAGMPIVAKSHTAKVAMKGGGQYSYTYADLADVTEAAMPLLTAAGLSFSCLPETLERGFILRGVLLHTSGETLEGSLPIQGNSPQELGSSLTYMRRYLLGCLTGIVTDDDDDGSLAQAAAKRPARKAATPPPPPREQAPPPEDPNAISKAQLGKIGALMGELKITARDDALAYVADVIGRPVQTRNELSKSEASKLIEALAAEVDTSKAGANA